MRVDTRPLTTAEISNKYEHLHFLQWRSRRIAREEVSAGNVEILSFEVRRAWLLCQHCGGSPCCPNCWFLESTEGDFIFADSWTFFKLKDLKWPKSKGDFISGSFPGRFVTIERWPRTGRILTATTSGEAMPIEFGAPDELRRLPTTWQQCRPFKADELPLLLRASIQEWK